MINAPNAVTLLRVFIVPVFIMAIFYRDFKLALFVFLIAALSDALDGFLARRLSQVTAIGVILDPIADKALIDSGFALLSYIDRIIPVWLTVIVLSRDVLLLFGGWLLATFGKLDRIRPTLLGKVTAFSQFFTLFLTLLNLNCSVCSGYCLNGVFSLTGLLTILSAFDYAFRGLREISSA
ncbi:MAG: CDP-alcohol phosphatidyltransferase family protein [Desulfurobacteriaceae bacterium]